MAKSKKTSDAFDMAADIRKEVAAESVADACSTSVPSIYSLAKGDNPRRAKYDKNADVIGYNLRLPANIHRLLKRHCMETNESMNNVVLVALYRDMKNWEDLAPCPHCGATQLEKGKKNSKIRDRQPRDIEKEIVDRGEYSYKNNLRELIHLAINEGHPKNMEQFKKLLASWGVDIFIKNNRVYATDLDIKEAGNPKCTFNLTRLDGRFALKSLQTVFETGTTESEKPMTYEQRRDVYIQRLKKAYSAWVEQAKASKGVSYNAFPKFVAPKCDEDLLEDPAVRDELLARRGYAKEIRNRYASAVPDYGEDNVRAAGQAGTHSVQHPVIESGRTREQSDRNVEH